MTNQKSNIQIELVSIIPTEIEKLKELLKADNRFREMMEGVKNKYRIFYEPNVEDEFLTFIILRIVATKGTDINLETLIFLLKSRAKKYPKSTFNVYIDDYIAIKSAEPPELAPEYPDGWDTLQKKLYSYILDKYPTSPVVANNNRENFSQVAAFIIAYFERELTFLERKPEQFIKTITLWPNLLNEALMLYCYATYPNDIIGKHQSAPGL